MKLVQCHVQSTHHPFERGRNSVGQLDDGQPEILDGTDDAHELIQVHRLGDVTVRVKVVAFENVFLGRRGCQNDNWQPAELRIGLDLSEVTTKATLADAFVVALRRLGQRIVSDTSAE